MDLLRHVVRCTAWSPSDFLRFEAAGRDVGFVRPHVADALSAARGFERRNDRLVLDPSLPDTAARSAVLADAMPIIARFTDRKASGEQFPLLARWGEAPLATVDRAATTPLGFAAYGVHVNGFVRRGEEILLWIGRRAMDRDVEPGKLDHIIAGGQPAGLSLRENLRKEAAEEAGLSTEWADRAVPVGSLTYKFAKGEGLRNDALFVFDLELPAHVVPENRDGEVASFELWPLDRVLHTLRTTDDFKFNVAMVVIEFLMRHGKLDPDREPDYPALAAGFRGVRPDQL
ncbi:NUDIX hydrolase [Roseiterribacter gracilis]|uniref:DUF4743 domain-containing protein n=1 Tax=Roseiterribacter gracilis TaxID=2812848 RepID=A0A8S8X6I0_9PROT|nr:DUF4743 domain-containing protein [Rhodospirillales bacterium TMPK1]